MTSINNVSSQIAQQNLVEAQKELTQTVVHLSTGKRINSAQDDAASLAISQNMVGQILAINQSVRNLNDATNMMQIADTGIASLQDMFLRIGQLAVQGRNDSLSSNQRINLVAELSSLNQEINNVIDRTKMNGNGLLTNSGVLNSSSGLQANVTNVGTLDDTYASIINVTGARPGIYKFSNVGASLTMTKTDYNDNVLETQTLTVTTPVGARNTDVLQTLNFNDFSISITLKSRTKPNNVNNLTDSGEEIAQKLSNIFKPIIVDEAIKLDFGSGATNNLLVSFRPINLTTIAKPDFELDPATMNQNGISNTNPSIMQILPSPTTAKGTYVISTTQTAAATEFELVGFTGTGFGEVLTTSNSVGINNGFSLTVGNRTYRADGTKETTVGGSTTITSGNPALSATSGGGFVSINEFTNWVNSLNDNNVSARLYQKSPGYYAVKINGGLLGADNAISFTNLNLAVGIDQYPSDTKIYGNVSLAADGKLTTSFPAYQSGAVNPANRTQAVGTSAAIFNGYEGNNSQYLSFNGSTYTSLYSSVENLNAGIKINNELGPVPPYDPDYYPFANAYDNRYDPGSLKYIGVPGGWSQSPAPPSSWYVDNYDRNYKYAYDREYDQTLNRTDQYIGGVLNPNYLLINRGDRDQPSSASYTPVRTTYYYSYSDWSNNFESNTFLLNSVVGIDPARDAKLSIAFNGGASRSITNDTNVFTDATSGLQINLTPGRQPWDGSASATIVVGDPQPALPRNNSNLVAVDRKIVEMSSFTSSNSRSEWNAAFDYLQDQAYKALDYLSYERGIVGAQMNRVDFINTNLRSQSINTEKSKSDLVDTDVAAESARFIQKQAHLEVSTRMVKEANSLVNPIKVLIGLWDDIKSK
jgi:flagellin-like hook-associated protein FlgL